eukprot:scaffold27789_cov48-Phaeocystis_antarctica.AAC.6
MPLVATHGALKRGDAARDRHRAGYRCLVEAHRARRRAAHRREAHLEPVGDGRARPPRASFGLVDDDRAAEHAVRAAERQRHVQRVRAHRAREQPVLGRQVAVLGHTLHWVVVAARRVGTGSACHCAQRHRRRVRRARCQRVVVGLVARRRLEKLDLATCLVARKRHVNAHARLPKVGARPARAVVLVDDDRAARDPHLATWRARVVHD